jgi:2-succinyl-6-hydroxy-2,4-cyclohexadiene-1-carboxylate synthase
MLYSQWTDADVESEVDSYPPTLVFLHGLLGNRRDWHSVTELLRGVNTLTIDLPGHGQSAAQQCDGFDECCQLVAEAIQSACSPDAPLYLVGYSLGGRIAMYGSVLGCFSDLNLHGILIEGGHFGLSDSNQSTQRLAADFAWADRFEKEPIAQVLTDWYEQPLFSSLNYEQKQTLIVQRSDNLGSGIAGMLRATTVAKQPDLLPLLQSLPLRCLYIHGARDAKFAQIAHNSDLPRSIIPNAGHNAHHEQPVEFARCIMRWVMA